MLVELHLICQKNKLLALKVEIGFSVWTIVLKPGYYLLSFFCVPEAFHTSSLIPRMPCKPGKIVQVLREAGTCPGSPCSKWRSQWLHPGLCGTGVQYFLPAHTGSGHAEVWMISVKYLPRCLAHNTPRYLCFSFLPHSPSHFATCALCGMGSELTGLNNECLTSKYPPNQLGVFGATQIYSASGWGSALKRPEVEITIGLPW